MPSFYSSSLSNALNQAAGSTALYRMLPLFGDSQPMHRGATLSLSTFVTLALLPLLAAFVLLLVPLAILTTCFAVFAIAFRSLLVYAELFANLFRCRSSRISELSAPSRTSVPQPEKSSPIRLSPPTFYRRSPSPELTKDVTYAQDLDITRDFEGLGGWCYPTSVAPDSETLSIQTLEAPQMPHLELPAPTHFQKHFEERKHKRKHARSLTGGSLSPLTTNAVGLGISGSRSQPDLGTMSPEDGHGLMRRPKSLVVPKDGATSLGKWMGGHAGFHKEAMGVVRKAVCT